MNYKLVKEKEGKLRREGRKGPIPIRWYIDGKVIAKNEGQRGREEV